MNLYTDASGSEGWGAFWNGRWLQAHWIPAQLNLPIVWKELFAIVNAVNSWGHLWTKRKILFHCDNRSVVDNWKKGSTRDVATMSLVHLLYFCAARYHINVVITHIPGTLNCIADSLSRFQNQRFHTLAPEALPTAVIIRAWPTMSFLHPCSNLFNSV